MAHGIRPNPRHELGASMDDSQSICIPRQIPKYGLPDNMYCRRGSKSPKSWRLLTAASKAPTPGKIRLYSLIRVNEERYRNPSCGLTVAIAKSAGSFIHLKDLSSFLRVFARLWTFPAP